MPLKRAKLELCVERSRSLSPGSPPTLVRLSAEFDVPAGGSPPAEAELREAAQALLEDMDRLWPNEARENAEGERSLEELLEAFHPRQPELVELLRDEGTISPQEYETLRRHFGPVSRVGGPSGRHATPFVGGAADRRPEGGARGAARTVPELLRIYGIESVKQAGAVRARRQISFEEYMALKDYFAKSLPEPPRELPR